MQWQKGRQESGYWKKTLYSFSIFGIGLDCHIIYYPHGSFIPPHVDEISNKSHRRLNIILHNPKSGGVFIKNGVPQNGRFQLFRPDKDKHEVTRLDKGHRTVLSFGIAY